MGPIVECDSRARGEAWRPTVYVRKHVAVDVRPVDEQDVYGTGSKVATRLIGTHPQRLDVLRHPGPAQVRDEVLPAGAQLGQPSNALMGVDGVDPSIAALAHAGGQRDRRSSLPRADLDDRRRIRMAGHRRVELPGLP